MTKFRSFTWYLFISATINCFHKKIIWKYCKRFFFFKLRFLEDLAARRVKFKITTGSVIVSCTVHCIPCRVMFGYQGSRAWYRNHGKNISNDNNGNDSSHGYSGDHWDRDNGSHVVEGYPTGWTTLIFFLLHFFMEPIVRGQKCRCKMFYVQYHFINFFFIIIFNWLPNYCWL